VRRLGQRAWRLAIVADRGFRALVRAVVERFPVAVATFAVQYAAALAMRVVVYHLQATEAEHALSFDARWISLPGFVGLAEGDAWWAGWTAAVVALVELVQRRSRRFPAVAVGALLACVGALVLVAHVELLFAMQTGLSWEAMGELIHAPSPGDIEDALKRWHLAFLLGAPLVFLALVRGGSRGAHVAAVVAFCAVLAEQAAEQVKGERKWVFAALREHGALFLYNEVVDNWLDASHAYLDRPVVLSARQAATLALIDPVFADPSAAAGPAITLLPSSERPRNVVMIILESTSFADIAVERPGGGVLMPFLDSLKARGATGRRHHATSNSSASAAFSLVTGLFPMPEMAVYAMRSDIELPALPRLFGRPMEAFLLTPARLESFFPRELLGRNGIDDIQGYYNLPAAAHGQRITKATRDERTVIAEFGRRVKVAAEPFFAVYYTYMPHFNYNDYGVGTHVFEPIDKRNRYLNNLAMLDGLLARLVGDLEAAGRMDSTVLVIVGDHGEAFEQHPKNVTHARHSYEENLAVPFIVVYPPLVPAVAVDALTSHADLPPTILDLFGIPFDPLEFQGNSLVRPFPPGRRIFAMGNEGALVSWRESGRKTILNLRKDTCMAFDLSTDPAEQTDLGCAEGDPEVDALLAWRLHQVRDVKARNAALRSARSAENTGR
jgi:arylsulfatase A-like enzyme